MRLSNDQARNLHNHLVVWDQLYNTFSEDSLPGRLHKATHLLVASYIEQAARIGTVMDLLRYLDGPLKSVVRTSMSICSMYGDFAGEPMAQRLLPKGIGYSHKDVRWQVLIWLGSSFDMNDPKAGESTENVEADHLILDELIGSVDEEAGNFSGIDTRAFPRYKYLDLTDEEESQIIQRRLEDGMPFPYAKWEVLKWGHVEGFGPTIHHTIRCYVFAATDTPAEVVPAQPEASAPTWSPIPATKKSKKETAATLARIKKIASKKSK